MYEERLIKKVRVATKKGKDTLRQLVRRIPARVRSLEAVYWELLVGFRTRCSWTEMIQVVDRMPLDSRDSAKILEQVGFALNRAGESQRAEKVLQGAVVRSSWRSETMGILGRIFKDRWERARDQDDPRAASYLDRAISVYSRGFEDGFDNAYPGINAATLLLVRSSAVEEYTALLSRVREALAAKIWSGQIDYFDLVTKVEIAAHMQNLKHAEWTLERALRIIREPWEAETTAHNLSLIRQAREARGEATAGWDRLENKLKSCCNQMLHQQSAESGESSFVLGQREQESGSYPSMTAGSSPSHLTLPFPCDNTVIMRNQIL